MRFRGLGFRALTPNHGESNGKKVIDYEMEMGFVGMIVSEHVHFLGVCIGDYRVLGSAFRLPIWGATTAPKPKP